MRVGSKWGWLTCVEVVGGWAEDGGGAVQEWVKEKEYRLKCRCGREVVVQVKDFKEKGKHGMRSCGLKGCGALGTGVGGAVGVRVGVPVESTTSALPASPALPAAASARVASMGEGVASMGEGEGEASTEPASPLPFTRLGRPPKYNSRAAVANFYLPVELVGWMRKAADAQGKSASQFMVELLERERGQFGKDQGGRKEMEAHG